MQKRPPQRRRQARLRSVTLQPVKEYKLALRVQIFYCKGINTVKLDYKELLDLFVKAAKLQFRALNCAKICLL